MEVKTGLPYAALGAAVTAVSFAAIFVRLTEAPAIAVAFYRLFFSTMLLVPVLYWQMRPTISLPTGPRRRALLLSCLSGVLLALHYFTWFQSLRLTTVASSTVLVTLHPFFVLWMAFLLWREPVNVRLVLAVVVTLIGGYIIGSGDLRVAREYLVGDILALVAAFFMSGYLLLGQAVRREFTLLQYVTVVYGTGALVCALIMLGTGTPFWGYSSNDYMVFLALALVPNLMGHTLFNWALGYLPASIISVSVLAEPVGATILALVILRELPTAAQLIGGSIIILGIGWFFLEKNRLTRQMRQRS